MATCCQNLGEQAASIEAAGSCEGQQAEPGFAWAKLAVAGIVAAQSMAFGMAINLERPEGTARLVIHSILACAAIGVFLLTGLPLLKRAMGEALRGRIVFEQLFLAGIFGAFFASAASTLSGEGSVYCEVVSILLAIYTLGTLLGDRRRKAALDSALRLDRDFSRCVRLDHETGVEEHVPVASVRSGDSIRCRPGEGVAIDGVVVDGIALVNEAALTGEPHPVVKREGDTVYAGSSVVDATIVIRASGGANRRLDQLLDAVRAAQANPSALQREADRLTRWFLPLIMLISVGTFGAWAFLGDWHGGLFNALAVLLVACPCAMGLATPIGIWSAIAALARKGLVAQSGDFIERLAAVDVVAFDKTGTLGEERMQVIDLANIDGENRDLLRSLAGAIQNESRHPLAGAFHAWHRTGVRAENIRPLPGIGIAGEVLIDEKRFVVELGNDGLIDRSRDLSAIDELGTLVAGASLGLFRVWMRVNGRIVALAMVCEKLRDSAAEAIAGLRELRCAVKVWTGDTAVRAGLHDLPNVEAGLSAEDKAARVAQEQRMGRRVLLVGDGINDAPGLSIAHASIGMAAGSDLAQSAAGARLFGADLTIVPEAIQLSRRVVRLIRQNLVFAACYNLGGVMLAALGLLHPVAAALVMLASSATVTWRALREADRMHVGETPALPERTGRASESFPRIVEGEAAAG